MTGGYLSRGALAGYLDVSPATVSRMVGAGTLPAPIYLTDALPRWDRSEVDAAIRGAVRSQATSLDDLISAQPKARGRPRHGRN
jgi:predicted DNA-binding transcriptional regulator AlpA